MIFYFENLKKKEIICVKDGFKIGYVDDLIFEDSSYIIKSLICYGRHNFLGFFKKTSDIIIPIDKVQIIGEDIILVNDYDRNDFEIKKRNKFLSLFFDD